MAALVAGGQRATVARIDVPALAVGGAAPERGRVRESLIAQLALDGVEDAISLVGEQARTAPGEAALHQEDLGLLAGLEGAARVIGEGLAIGPGERRPAQRVRDGHEKALPVRGWDMGDRPDRLRSASLASGLGQTDEVRRAPHGREERQGRLTRRGPPSVVALVKSGGILRHPVSWRKAHCSIPYLLSSGPMNAARVLRYARRRAGLTQRELAARAGVPQPAIARIESGAVSPRVDTLAHLIGATGSSLELAPKLGEGVDRTMFAATLALTAEQRIEAAGRAGTNLAGLPARDPTWPHARLTFGRRRSSACLARHEVRYVLIGGLAAITHGAGLVTQDVDICYARDQENLERLADALREVHADLRGAEPGLPFRLDAKTLERGRPSHSRPMSARSTSSAPRPGSPATTSWLEPPTRTASLAIACWSPRSTTSFG